MSFTKKQLLPGEKLIVLTHRHPFVLFRAVLMNILALAILLGLSIISQQAWFMAFYLAPLAYFFWEFLAWQKREYILTDRRVVKQEGVFSVSSYDAPLDKINNVFHQQTFLGRLFRYGDVGLETASEKGITIFNLLSRPVDFKNSIVRQRELYRADISPSNTPSPPGIPQLLEELATLRDRNIITSAEFEEKKKALLGRI